MRNLSVLFLGRKSFFPPRGRFYLPQELSPSYFNLSRYLPLFGWRPTSWSVLADLSPRHFAFYPPAADCLEHKHLLAQLVQTYCPSLMPATYCINDNNWPEVLQSLVQAFPQETAWILKPALLNNGQGIKIFTDVQAIEHHFLSSARLGGEHVLQLYIPVPHLLRDRRKYSIRQFMVLTNYAGHFVYRHGYFNVARHPFSADFKALKAHLTNEHLSHEEPNVIQIPSNEFSFYPGLYSHIKEHLTRLVSALASEFPSFLSSPQHPVLALFGVDFMVDESGRVWLLEVNHGPCFPTSNGHPLQSVLYCPFWHSFIKHFILPPASKTVSQFDFEPLI